MSFDGHRPNTEGHAAKSPVGAPPMGALWTDEMRKAVGYCIQAAADDGQLFAAMVVKPVETAQAHKDTKLTAPALRQLLGLPAGAGDVDALVQSALSARILCRAKGADLENDGLMCGCGVSAQ